MKKIIRNNQGSVDTGYLLTLLVLVSVLGITVFYGYRHACDRIIVQSIIESTPLTEEYSTIYKNNKPQMDNRVEEKKKEIRTILEVLRKEYPHYLNSLLSEKLVRQSMIN